MRAEAVIHVERRGGRSVCVRLRSDPPITLRRTGEGEVHQVGSGAGPIGGDELRLTVRVGAGASLTLRTVAAAVVLPGPSGLPSRVVFDADVGSGGHLSVLPEPQVLARGADHEVRTTVRLAEGATLCWRDESVSGRHDEEGGSLLHRLRVDRAGLPLVRSDLTAGPRWPDSSGPAGLDGARCFGTLLWVGSPDGPPGPDRRPAADGPPMAGGVAGPGDHAGAGRRASFVIAPGAVLVSALGGTSAAVRRGLHAPVLVHT